MGRTNQRASLAQKLNNYTLNEGCWEYNGCTNNYGYCLIMVNRKLQYAHRLAYKFHKGDIPKGMTVDHICFNRKCINPAHLRLLSHSDNARRHKQSQRKEFCSICGDKKTQQPNGRWHCRRCSCRRTKEYRKRCTVGRAVKA